MEVLKLVAVVLCCLSISNASPDDHTSFRFIAHADWGGCRKGTTEEQLLVAKQMGKTADTFKPQAVFAIGDNFYSEGVDSVDSERFKVTFEDVYTAKSLQSPTQWYVVAGNHDHKGSVQAQIDYSERSDRWHFPDYYYSEVFTTHDSDGKSATVEVVMLDTIIMTADYNDPQWTWLENTLKKSSADWLLVMGHYPVYSIAEHGPNGALLKHMKPLLEKYKVAAYFCGHDHNLQHLIDGDVHYYLTGASHNVDRSQAHRSKVPEEFLQFHWPKTLDFAAKGGFVTGEVTPHHLRVKYFDHNGKELHSSKIKNPRRAAPKSEEEVQPIASPSSDGFMCSVCHKMVEEVDDLVDQEVDVEDIESTIVTQLCSTLGEFEFTCSSMVKTFVDNMFQQARSSDVCVNVGACLA